MVVSIFAQSLSVTPLSVAAGDQIYRLWYTFCGYANIILVLVCLAVIFAYATSIGMSKYGIKRILPRLLGAAIYINLSYYIFAFVVGGFNVAGAGIEQLVNGILQSSNLQGNGIRWEGLFGVAAIGLGGIVLNAGAFLPWLLNLLLAAALIVLIAMFALVVRQMLIVVLIVVGPVVIALGIIEESWEARWRRLLLRLLMMYPLLVLVAISGRIVAVVLANGSFRLTQAGGASEVVANAVAIALGTAANALPFVLAPLTFSWAGNLMSSVQQGLGGIARRVPAGLRNIASAGPPPALPGFIPGHRAVNNVLGRVSGAVRNTSYVLSGAAAENFRTQRTGQAEDRLRRLHADALTNPLGRALAGGGEAAQAARYTEDKKLFGETVSRGQTLIRAAMRDYNFSDSDLRRGLMRALRATPAARRTLVMTDDNGVPFTNRDGGEFNVTHFMTQNPSAFAGLQTTLAQAARLPELWQLRSGTSLVGGEDDATNQERLTRIFAENADKLIEGGGEHLLHIEGYNPATGRTGAVVREEMAVGQLEDLLAMSTTDIAGQRAANLEALEANLTPGSPTFAAAQTYLGGTDPATGLQYGSLLNSRMRGVDTKLVSGAPSGARFAKDDVRAKATNLKVITKIVERRLERDMGFAAAY